MGNTNTLPVVSQAKSVVQLVTGDAEGAARTQEQFFHECPVVAQVTSLGYLAAGDTEKFEDTNLRSVKTISNFADGVPVVGHVKGTIHYIAGDKEGGDKAMKSASRTTGVIAGGAGGFLVGGPVGAVAGGMAGGAAMDSITTVVDSAIHDEFRPSGYIAAIDQVVENPNGGNVFDLVAMPVFDGVAGYGAGQMTAKIQNVATESQINTLANQRQVMLDAMESQAEAGQLNSGQMLQMSKQIDAKTAQITALENAAGKGTPVFNPKTGTYTNVPAAKPTPAGCSTSTAGTVNTPSEQQQEGPTARTKYTPASSAVEEQEQPYSQPTYSKQKQTSGTRTRTATSFRTQQSQNQETGSLETDSLDELTEEIFEGWLRQADVYSPLCQGIVERWMFELECAMKRGPACFTDMFKEKYQANKDKYNEAMELFRQILMYRGGRKLRNRVDEQSDSDSDSDDDEEEDLRCLQWNCCGLFKQLSSIGGLLTCIVFFKPSVILLNETKIGTIGGELGVDLFARILGYKCVNLPSTSPRGQPKRGSAVLYKRKLRKIHEFKQGLVYHNGSPGLEVAGIDVEHGDSIYRIMTCYRAHHAYITAVMESVARFKRSSGTTIVAGDFNISKDVFLQKWRQLGLVDTLHPSWDTNRQGASFSKIDYVMVNEGDENNVLCHRPLRPLGRRNVLFPIIFDVDEDISFGPCSGQGCDVCSIAVLSERLSADN